MMKEHQIIIFPSYDANITLSPVFDHTQSQMYLIWV